MALFGFGSTNKIEFDNDFHREFWSEFRGYLEQHENSLKPYENLFDPINYSGSINSYSGFDFGTHIRESLWLIGWIWPERSQIAAKLRIASSQESLFQRLKEDQGSIQERFGETRFTWDSPPRFSIGVYQYNVDFTDYANRDNLFEWLHINLEKIEQVFINKFAEYFLDTFR